VVRDKVVGTETEPPVIDMRYVKTNNQLVDIFVKPLRKVQIDFICNKLSMIDIYAPT
jgi:hypothetical protein